MTAITVAALQLGGKRPHRDHAGMLERRAGERKQRLVLLTAEIGAAEQFGRQDQLRALRSGVFYQRGDGGDIRGFVIRAEGKL